VASQCFDAIVVGAGIVGAACARELAANGLKVAICEASDHVGGGATGAGMGHLAVMDDSEPQFALTSFSQRLWRELSEELPADSEYWQCGSLWVAADAEEFAEVERKFRFYSARGVSVEVLDSLQLAEAEPHLRPGLVGALLMASDSVCYPPCAARYFVERATGYGANLFLNSSATEVSDSGVKTQQGQELVAGSVILATGAEACKLVPAVDVRPRKGHLLITDRYPGFLRHQLIELGYLKSAHSSTSDSVAFNAQPRVTGQILIGSSRQFGVEEGTAEQRMIARMLARAQQYMPALKDLFAIRAWTGFRAATPDKLPLIGLCPGYQRVYLATGHEGLGISSSLGTARLIADEILGRESEIARALYHPERSFALHA
jgi:glycine/D-amino acid oxidase-like deaminating enzyme